MSVWQWTKLDIGKASVVRKEGKKIIILFIYNICYIY
jgi:hypothetical protein